MLIIHVMGIKAEVSKYGTFNNYRLSDGANSVRFFIQDSQGLMWIGTNKGLYSFDGYNAYPHFIPGTRTNNTIHCGLQYNDNFLLLGFETGPMLYDIKKDKYEPFILDFDEDVRSLVKTDSELWIGCANGLFIYNLASGKIEELLIDPQTGTKHKMIYALLEDGDYMYLGSWSNFGRYSQKTKKYEALGFSANSSNFYVNSLLKDEIRNCIWVGRGFGLLKYLPDSGTLENVGEFFVVKTMALDHANNVIMGTDNGLCIYNELETKCIVHDSREPKSLANNIVWCVYKDQSENIWFGTDNGISMSPKYHRFNHIPIHKITGTGEGNQFYTIFRDTLNNYWLGGTNGLIRSKNSIGENTETRWYKMGGSEYYISHNRIRDIFEDNGRNLWIATDYGVNRYNSQSQKFIKYSIYAPNGIQNANWTYDILEDDFNRLWIATFKDGIFVIDKKKLLSGKTSQIADIHYSVSNGLSGNNIDFIVLDKKENVWALVHNTALDVINVRTGEITNFPIENFTGKIIPGYLMSDSQGFVWAGYRNGAIMIDPENNDVKNISFNGTNNADILAMAEVENSIWASTTDGIWIIDKKELTTQRMNPVNQFFTGMFYDKAIGTLVLGGIDGITLLNPDIKPGIKPEKIMISAIYVNNQPYKNKENTPGVRYTDEIVLAHNQNNIKIEFSDLSYFEEDKEQFVYKLNDDEKWSTLVTGENSIQLSKLIPGTYILTIGKISNDGEPSELTKNFSIIVKPPWYGTLFAKIVYSLFIFSFIWWVYFFITAKNRMKYEQMEKEQSLEQSRLKIAFFSDVAHEFKTPLSLIIAPLSRLIHTTKNHENRNALEMVHQNAMKLNSLIHQAIDYYRDDSKVNIGLLLTKAELVEFARSIFFTYKEGMKDKHIEFIFNTNADQVFMNIDTVKIESVFNNLISNACKFTNPGDSIILSIDYNPGDSSVEIKLSDTGVGIPKQDLPYIFQRFFQSPANSKGKEGTGIGLFLVKNYIELHGGKVNVTSEMGEGTSFTIWLPVMEPNVESKPVEINSLNGNDDKQLIAIIEDNVAIAEFIYNIFTPEYRCIIAHNGKTGLKACMELNPDIIIADVMMPVMDGLEMAHRLKNHIPTSTIPLIFLTARDDKETELKSIELNIEAFIAKPFDSTILYSRVQQILKNRKLLEKKARIDQLATPKMEKTESLDEKFLAKVTRIIEDKMADPGLNVNILCELADISTKQLYRKIKQLTGLTAVDYIRSIRMKKAAMYLSNKNFTVAEVMYMVGFSNHSYFAKCFQAAFGKTPRQFIEQKKEM
ncbi:MAG: response regulator [Bacteroidales bacterium]|nr:response regulator [Bacteroidales bacterium]